MAFKILNPFGQIVSKKEEITKKENLMVKVYGA
jgi:hypothetical protein